MIDTHCHPNLNKIKSIDDIINNFFGCGGEKMIVVGTNRKEIEKVLDIARKNENIFVIIGFHPCDVYDENLENTIEYLENIYKENKDKIIGIGEIGLDYYRLYKDGGNGVSPLQVGEDWVRFHNKLEEKRSKQRDFFVAQIKLAQKLNLPVIIHNRESKNEIFEIIKETNLKNFIFHCYSENLEYAQKLIEFSPNCKISFSGIVTFSNAKDIQETAKNIPLKNILTETDSPYLTPVPFRGKEENEPVFTKYVVEKIAELRGEDLEFVEKEILKNSKEVFEI